MSYSICFLTVTIGNFQREQRNKALLMKNLTYLKQFLPFIFWNHISFQFIHQLTMNHIKKLISRCVRGILIFQNPTHQCPDNNSFQEGIQAHGRLNHKSAPEIRKCSQQNIIHQQFSHIFLIIFEVLINFRGFLRECNEYPITIPQNGLMLASINSILKQSLKIRIIVFYFVVFFIMSFSFHHHTTINGTKGQNFYCPDRIHITFLLIAQEGVGQHRYIVNQSIQNFRMTIKCSLNRVYFMILQELGNRRHKKIIKTNDKNVEYCYFIRLLNKKMNKVQVDIDSIIHRLLEVRNCKPGKLVKLTEMQIFAMIQTVRSIFLSQPMLVEVSSPVKVCGDIHGQYYDLLRLFEYGGIPPDSSYLFLGDYVDRGRQGIQTICLLYALKIKYPNMMHILRGNHQSASITRIYGFYQECKNRYSPKLWKSFVDCFNCMPVAAVIEDKILCMHGGLSPELLLIQQIREIVRPTDVPDTGMLCDLLWADPDSSIKMWGESERGVSYVFGSDVITSFLKKNDLDLICRAHQVVEDGYEFFGKKQLVTIFSAPNYCGEFNNSGALMRIQEDLTCSFQVLRPQEKVGPFRNNRPKTPIKRGGG